MPNCAQYEEVGKDVEEYCVQHMIERFSLSFTTEIHNNKLHVKSKMCERRTKISVYF